MIPTPGQEGECLQSNPNGAEAVTRSQFLVPAPGGVEANHREDEVGNLVTRVVDFRRRFLWATMPF